jgi:hypothetical protein
MSAKPIETHYKGYRFRSRLEARWAVFFDTLGVTYHYELQGFNLDGRPYLPDFWLPHSEGRAWPQGTPPVAGHWLEIKPHPLTPREESLALSLARQTRHHAYAVAGEPWPGEFGVYHFPHNGRQSGEFWPPTLCWSCKGSGVMGTMPGHPRVWRGAAYYPETVMECPCQSEGDDLHHNSLWHLHRALRWAGAPDDGAPGLPCIRPYELAFKAARSARFEHGDSPWYRNRTRPPGPPSNAPAGPPSHAEAAR